MRLVEPGVGLKTLLDSMPEVATYTRAEGSVTVYPTLLPNGQVLSNGTGGSTASAALSASSSSLGGAMTMSESLLSMEPKSSPRFSTLSLDMLTSTTSSVATLPVAPGA